MQGGFWRMERNLKGRRGKDGGGGEGGKEVQESLFEKDREDRCSLRNAIIVQKNDQRLPSTENVVSTSCFIISPYQITDSPRPCPLFTREVTTPPQTAQARPHSAFPYPCSKSNASDAPSSP